MLTSVKLFKKILIFATVMVLLIFVCTLIGSQDVSLLKAIKSIGGEGKSDIDFKIIFNVRLPRVLLAGVIGAALAASGVILQAILRNPLAEPYILGISSGAGLGVMIAIITGASWGFLGGSTLAVFAFAGALFTVWLVWQIGKKAGGKNVTALLLAGVVVNAFFSAVIMFLTSVVKSDKVYSTIFWLMGNITDKGAGIIFLSFAVVTIGIVILFFMSNHLNVLTFGMNEAQSLGVNPKKVQVISICIASFITAVAVSLSGLIGFVGLIIPHGIRLLFGPDHRQLIPLSAISGAMFLMAADTLARTIVAPAQLPVGVITAIAGGPFFLIILARQTRKAGWLR